MSSGFGLIDYVVVLVICLSSASLLATRPSRLLLFLPTFLTVDFFIPLGTQLTPYRIIPLMVIVWLILTGTLSANRRFNGWLALLLLSVIGSLLVSLSIDDAGLRPVLRAAHYLGLLALFVFVCRVMRRPANFEKGLFGVLIAGAVHATYAAYQIVAFRIGLPFRGIVYSESGEGGVAEIAAGGLIRVNGLADEPKRLGYILFCSAIVAMLFLVQKSINTGRPSWTIQSIFRTKSVLLVVLLLSAVMSFFTFSGSYIAAVGMVSAAALLIVTKRAVSVIFPLTMMLALSVVVLPERFPSVSASALELFEDRILEVKQGVNAANVYRQEFYVQDYLSRNSGALFVGVGIGRYNTVLAQEYGWGAGFTRDGTIKPLNSQVFEVGFDLGLAGLLVLYGGCTILALSVRKVGTTGIALSVIMLFMIFQSMFIQNLHLLAFLAGMCAALLSMRDARNLSKGGERGLSPLTKKGVLPTGRSAPGSQPATLAASHHD